LQAGIYLLFYTLTASLPLLGVLVYLYREIGTLEFILLRKNLVYGLNSVILFFTLSIAFLVKIPIFFTHLWLPKAHVEAPVSGSMVLAGVLLKLGGYGLLRAIPLIRYSLGCIIYFYGAGLIGIVYVGLMCCRLNDLKALVAYSSVAHIALVICGIFSFYS